MLHYLDHRNLMNMQTLSALLGAKPQIQLSWCLHTQQRFKRFYICNNTMRITDAKGVWMSYFGSSSRIIFNELLVQKAVRCFDH